jgi:hypothetical protein
MKEIVLRTNGKKIHQFTVSDAELNLAKKLGISEKTYIAEKTMLELDNKNKENAKVWGNLDKNLRVKND